MATKNTMFYRNNFVHFAYCKNAQFCYNNTCKEESEVIKKKLIFADLVAYTGERKQYGFRKKNQSNSADL